MHKPLTRPAIFFVLFALCLAANTAAQTVDGSKLGGLQWRNIGPFRGGRVASVTGAVGRPGTFYIGLPAGGIWKTTSNGQTWYPVGDSIKEVCCFGSIQAAPTNPDIVYAGSGEAIGGYGNGVYKSVDGGKSWGHLPGLEESKQIPTILVDPHDPNVVLVASLGNDGARTKQRGVFRTTDGGQTWSHPLFIDDTTGVIHMAWSYDNPSVIYALSSVHFGQVAALGLGVTVSNKPSAIYKSTDEGLTWQKLDAKGLPELMGRSCLAVAETTQSQRVYMIGQYGLYRSDDGGANWHQMAKNDNRIMNGQGDYNCGVYVDPKNPDIVYTISTCVFRSTDGGNTFEGFKGAPGGDDPHDMWIDPNDGDRILLGSDQGATVSVDGGKTWGLWYNQSTEQTYHISADNQFPYWVYATQQDGGCIATASRGNLGEITMLDWRPQPGFEFGTTIPDPANPNVFYALGWHLSLMKLTYPSGQWIEVGPDLDPGEPISSGFNAAMAFSPSNPHELIVAYNRLMATDDGGVHWHPFSPDLTGAKSGPRPGGFFHFGLAIETFSECTAASGTIWAGTNNGFIWVTRDRGKNWVNVSIPKLPRGSGVICIDASHRNPAEAYAAITIPGSDALSHFYRTRDYGKTWTEIVEGLPKEMPYGGPANVIRADTKKDGLLFAGTNTAVYVSFDDGDHWQSLMLNLPTTAYRDLQVHGNDLIAGTYGRGIWILDDFSPLREVTAATLAEPAHLYKPGDAIRVRRNVNMDTPFPPEVPHAENPPPGAVIYYSFSQKPGSDIQLEVVDSDGNVVRHYTSSPNAPFTVPPTNVPDFWIAQYKPLPTEIGLNRINWDGRYDMPNSVVHDPQDTIWANPGETPPSTEGPFAPPGAYTIKLMVDGQSYAQSLTFKNDPRSPASVADVKAECELQKDYYVGAQTAWDGLKQVTAMRGEVAKVLAAKPADPVVKALKEFDGKLDTVGGNIFHGRPIFGPPPPTSFGYLNPFFLSQMSYFDMGDMRPTDKMELAYGFSWSKLHAMCEQWRALKGKGLADLNAVLTKNGIAAIATPTADLVEPPKPSSRFLPAAKTEGMNSLIEDDKTSSGMQREIEPDREVP